MIKLTVVDNEKLKILIHVRNHPEELLVPKIWFSFFSWKKGEQCSLGSYDKIKKSLECDPESSHTHKNSSLRTPCPKISFSWLFFNVNSQKWSLWPYDKIKWCLEYHPEISHTCKKSSRTTPCPTGQNFITVLFLMSKVLHCLQSKNQQNESFGRGVLRDEFLRM